MKAVIVSRFGPPEVLQFREMRAPVLREGMVRVEVRAVGLNFADIMGRLGVYPGIPNPPFIPGIEFSGEILETAEEVHMFKPGDRVMGFTPQGAYAPQVCVSAQHIRKMPPRMTYEEGAAFSVTYMSAWHGMKTLGHVRPGETLLLHAAAGGVGTAALQLAKHWKVRVIATASTPVKLTVAKDLGAAHVVNYVEEDLRKRVREITGGRGVDLVMDSVGGSVFRKSWKLLAPMGRYVLYGFASVTGARTLEKLRMLREVVQTPLIWPPNMVSKNVSLMGFNMYFLTDKSNYLHTVADELIKLYAKKVVRPVIGRTFSFEDVVAAHRWLQGRKSVGKVVMSVP